MLKAKPGREDEGINKRLSALREKMEGPRGKLRFAKKIGESHSNLSRYENGRTIPAHVISRIVAAYGVNPEWLLTGKGEMRLPLPGSEMRQLSLTLPKRQGKQTHFAGESAGELNDFYVLPLLRDPTAAGPGRRISDYDVEGPAVIHKAWCPHPDQTDYVRVKGDSMAPAVPDGSIVTIDKTFRDAARLAGRVVAIYISRTEEVTLRRLHRDDVNPSRFVGVPDNPSPQNRPHVIEEDDRIIGVVMSVHALVE